MLKRIRRKLLHQAQKKKKKRFPQTCFFFFFFKTGSVKKAALEVLFDILVMPQTPPRSRLLCSGSEVRRCQRTEVPTLDREPSESLENLFCGCVGAQNFPSLCRVTPGASLLSVPSGETEAGRDHRGLVLP